MFAHRGQIFATWVDELESKGAVCSGMKTLSFIDRTTIGLASFAAIVNPRLTIYLHLNAFPQ
jgi:hypothetical protein